MRNVEIELERIANRIRMREGFLACLALCSCGAAQAQDHEILLLQPGKQDSAEYDAIEAGLRSEFAKASIDGTRIFGEFVDLDFRQPRDRDIFADYLRAKYGEAGIDAVVALSHDSVSFVTEHRDAVGNVPLVYTARAGFAVGAVPQSSAVVMPFAPSRTVELALLLQPDLANLFVVSGASTWDEADLPALRGALSRYADRLSIEYLTGMTPNDLLDHVARLPSSSAVLYASLGETGTPSRELAEQISSRANAPVYGIHDSDVGRGIVGGFMTKSEQVGAELARQTLRMLRDEYPAVADVPGGSFVVDARALARWGLDQTRLPPYTDISFAPASIWSLYQGWIITLLVLVAVQFALIVTLLIQSISRRRDRLALAETAHRFRLARVAGRVGIWQWDLENDRLIVEPELRELLGYDTVERPNEQWSSRIHEDDLPKLRRAAHDHAQGLTPSFELQYRILDRNGNVRWLLSRGQAMVARNRLIGTAIDITDRKREEDERARTQAQLQEQQTELAHLGRAAMAGALSGAVAHELNQPLSAMMSNARAALQFLARGPADRQEIKDILTDIESDGRRAGEVIGHLRSLLRRGEAQFGTVRLDVIIDQVLRLIHSDLVNLNVKVLHDRAIGIPPISGDSVQLQQVLLNLLGNACDALKSVDPRDRRISIAVSPCASGRVRVSVADNGCGLSGGNAEQLFKPFFTTKRSGLGLGLSISRSIVNAHGGSIWAENNRDAGATFHVELAVETATVAAADRVA